MRCAVCQSSKTNFWASASDVEYQTSAHQSIYFRCENCHSLSLKDPPLKRLNQIYPANYYTVASKKSAIEKFKKLLDKKIVRHWLMLIEKPADQIIEVGDFGGGDGYFGILSNENSRNVRSTVIDFSPKEVVYDVKDISYVTCDLNSSFPEKKFDLIIAWNLLEHLVDPEDFLIRCFSNLNENGLLALQTPASNNLFAILTRKFYWGGLHSPRHFVIYSGPYLKKSLLGKGFEIISQKYVQDAHFATVSICHIFKLDRKVSKETSILSLKSYKLLLPFVALFSTIWSQFFPSGQIQFLLRKQDAFKQKV
jgi:hypothetical protein